MLASLDGANTIDETHLTEVSVTDPNANLPPVFVCFVYVSQNVLATAVDKAVVELSLKVPVVGLEVHKGDLVIVKVKLDVIFEAVHFDTLPVEEDLL